MFTTGTLRYVRRVRRGGRLEFRVSMKKARFQCHISLRFIFQGS